MNLLEAIAREADVVFTGEFAVSATFTPAGGASRPVGGIFDRISELTDIGELISADGVAAMFNVYSGDIADAALGDSMTVQGNTYRVVGLEPDGTGRTVMILGI